MTITKIGKWGGFAILGLLLITIYGLLDPADSGYFPACPFHSLTGLQCPGCGSQRAVHHLLNFELRKAFEHNSLLIVAIPYVLVGFYLDRSQNLPEKIGNWKSRLYGREAIILVLIVIILFWILRNL